MVLKWYWKKLKIQKYSIPEDFGNAFFFVFMRIFCKSVVISVSQNSSKSKKDDLYKALCQEWDDASL